MKGRGGSAASPGCLVNRAYQVFRLCCNEVTKPGPRHYQREPEQREGGVQPRDPGHDDLLDDAAGNEADDESENDAENGDTDRCGSSLLDPIDDGEDTRFTHGSAYTRHS